MASRRRRLEKALHGCAEAGVPDTTDLWTAVNERATGERVDAEPAGRGRVDTSGGRRSPVPRIVPNTPLGWTLAAVSVLILGLGVYAAVGPLKEFYRQGLSGAVETGSGERNPGDPDQWRAAQESGVSTTLFRQALPGDEDLSLAENVNQTVNRDGASVTLEWAYTDTNSVVLGFSVRDLKEDRRNAGNPAPLNPIFVSEKDEDVPSAPDRRSTLTDKAGGHFGSIEGGTTVVAGTKGSREPRAQTAVFEAPESLEAGRDQGLRFDVFLEEEAVAGSMAEAEGLRSEPKPPIGPLTFDFEVPVRAVPVFQVDQDITVDGTTLTLKRVINSPGRPEAEICITPPDENHVWHPSVAQVGYASDEPPSPRAIGAGCWSVGLGDPASGRSSVTVAGITGDPREFDPEGGYSPKTVRGPWTFEFDTPERLKASPTDPPQSGG